MYTRYHVVIYRYKNNPVQVVRDTSSVLPRYTKVPGSQRQKYHAAHAGIGTYQVVKGTSCPGIVHSR